MTKPQTEALRAYTWRHASTCEYERADGACSCGLATTEGHITALRSALEAVWISEDANAMPLVDLFSEELEAVVHRALDSTASAATEEVERIESRWREALADQHRKVVSEWSGNMAGHYAIRESWLEPDPDEGWPAAEPCDICALLDNEQ